MTRRHPAEGFTERKPDSRKSACVYMQVAGQSRFLARKIRFQALRVFQSGSWPAPSRHEAANIAKVHAAVAGAEIENPAAGHERRVVSRETALQPREIPQVQRRGLIAQLLNVVLPPGLRRWFGRVVLRRRNG